MRFCAAVSRARKSTTLSIVIEKERRAALSLSLCLSGRRVWIMLLFVRKCRFASSFLLPPPLHRPSFFLPLPPARPFLYTPHRHRLPSAPRLSPSPSLSLQDTRRTPLLSLYPVIFFSPPKPRTLPRALSPTQRATSHPHRGPLCFPPARLPPVCAKPTAPCVSPQFFFFFAARPLLPSLPLLAHVLSLSLLRRPCGAGSYLGLTGRKRPQCKRGRKRAGEPR